MMHPANALSFASQLRSFKNALLKNYQSNDARRESQSENKLLSLDEEAFNH